MIPDFFNKPPNEFPVVKGVSSWNVMNTLYLYLSLSIPLPTDAENRSIVPYEPSRLDVPAKNLSFFAQLEFLRQIVRAILILLKKAFSVENVKTDGAGGGEGLALLRIGEVPAEGAFTLGHRSAFRKGVSSFMKGTKKSFV